MRLINIRTSRLEDFSLRQKPSYAALSHRWTENELTFNDICAPSFDLTSTSTKFQGLLQHAQKHGLEYVWIDTCCIDKANNSELSEAINSMYQWYHNAQYCYVYLHDVQKSTFKDQFSKSEWFTRGWTLQELLAPRNIVFFDHTWQPLGDKEKLADNISRVTGIQSEVLRTSDFSRCSVAQKTAWSANRITTRPEDQAYCLMGLFGVNMPLLYGEGNRAFIRLQEEIIRHDDDHTIFAWSMKSSLTFSGLLAPDPSCFNESHDVTSNDSQTVREPFSMTNRGLRIKLEITPWLVDTYVALLDCSQLSFDEETWTPRRRILGIFVRRLEEHGQYMRFNHGEGGLWSAATDEWDRPYQPRQLFVRQNPKLRFLDEPRLQRRNGFQIPGSLPQPLLCTSCPGASSDTCCVTLPPGEMGPAVAIDFEAEYGGLRKLALGFDFDFTPTCLVEIATKDPSYSNVTLRGIFKQIVRDDPYDGWQKMAAGEDSLPLYLYKNPFDHPGLWLLKGQPGQTFEVLLSECLSDKGLLMRFFREPFSDSQGLHLTWTFDLDSVVGPSQNLNKMLRGEWTRRSLQEEAGLSMSEKDLRRGDSIVKGWFPCFPGGTIDLLAVDTTFRARNTSR